MAPGATHSGRTVWPCPLGAPRALQPPRRPVGPEVGAPASRQPGGWPGRQARRAAGRGGPHLAGPLLCPREYHHRTTEPGLQAGMSAPELASAFAARASIRPDPRGVSPSRRRPGGGWGGGRPRARQCTTASTVSTCQSASAVAAATAAGQHRLRPVSTRPSHRSTCMSWARAGRQALGELLRVQPLSWGA